jgi:hypothetical protein
MHLHWASFSQWGWQSVDKWLSLLVLLRWAPGIFYTDPQMARRVEFWCQWPCLLLYKALHWLPLFFLFVSLCPTVLPGISSPYHKLLLPQVQAFIIYLLVILGIELWTSHLLVRQSTTWVTCTAPWGLKEEPKLRLTQNVCLKFLGPGVTVPQLRPLCELCVIRGLWSHQLPFEEIWCLPPQQHITHLSSSQVLSPTNQGLLWLDWVPRAGTHVCTCAGRGCLLTPFQVRRGKCWRSFSMTITVNMKPFKAYRLPLAIASSLRPLPSGFGCHGSHKEFIQWSGVTRSWRTWHLKDFGEIAKTCDWLSLSKFILMVNVACLYLFSLLSLYVSVMIALTKEGWVGAGRDGQGPGETRMN